MPIADLISEMNAHFGKEVIQIASTMSNVRRIPFGVPVMDYATGGGVPIGRNLELYGPYSSTKSLLAYKAIAEFQHYDWNNNICRAIKEVQYKESKVKSTIKDGEGSTKIEQIIYEADKIIVTDKRIKDPKVKRVALVDYENSFDKKWGEHLGIDTKGLLHVVPEKGSELVDIVDYLLRSEDICLVVIDSVSAASSDLETDESAEKEQMGVNARFWNKAMRKFQAAMNANPEEDITLITINRPYTKIGMVFGDPTEVGGGSGLKFGKSISISLNPLVPVKKKVEGEDIAVGRNIKVKCVKNKTAPPFKEGDMYFSFVDDGKLKMGDFDITSQLISIGVKEGLIQRNGAFYIYGEHKIQGREKFANYLEEENLTTKLKDDLYSTFNA